MSIDFNKKNVLVIGGSSGIGRGIAESFVNYNANVCITGTRDSICLLYTSDAADE